MPHPNNKRVYFATHGVSVGGTTVQGAQSVSLNTNFNLEQVFQLGRLAIYDTITLDPEVEVTISKALDGHPLIWNLANNAAGASIADSEDSKTTIVLGVGDDDSDALANTANHSVTMTGCYISSLNYTFPVDGQFTEEITFLGNHKEITGSVLAPDADPITRVLARQNWSRANSTLPAEVGTQRLSQITVSADLGREAIFELGAYYAYHRFVNFPLEITVAFDVISGDVDGVEVIQSVVSDCAHPENLNEKQPIVLSFCNAEGAETYEFDFRDTDDNPTATLQSVSYSGGDTGGGNVTTTYTYTVYNTLTITGPLS
jgi:hypothetical protein